MEPITISRGGDIVAHYTTESCLSHYGQPVWVIEKEDIEPGPATWQQDEQAIEIDILRLASVQTAGRPSVRYPVE